MADDFQQAASMIRMQKQFGVKVMEQYQKQMLDRYRELLKQATILVMAVEEFGCPVCGASLGQSCKGGLLRLNKKEPHKARIARALLVYGD
jgi:hypothetical protein